MLFFLKGGRALNCFLGTPERAKRLGYAGRHQRIFPPKSGTSVSRRPDVLLSTLQAFRDPTSAVVKANAPRSRSISTHRPVPGRR